MDVIATNTEATCFDGSPQGLSIESIKWAASRCTNCELHKGRKVPVFDKGNPNASIMICGMVPADEENAVGIPFVGRAGKLLDRILEDSALSLDNVYITNLVKCYLAAGLPLKEDWVSSCSFYLKAQIEAIEPDIIITLGKDASLAMIADDITKPMGKSSLGKIISNNPYMYMSRNKIVRVLTTYHPSYLLRGGGENHRNYTDVVNCFIEAKDTAAKEPKFAYFR